MSVQVRFRPLVGLEARVHLARHKYSRSPPITQVFASPPPHESLRPALAHPASAAENRGPGGAPESRKTGDGDGPPAAKTFSGKHMTDVRIDSQVAALAPRLVLGRIRARVRCGPADAALDARLQEAAALAAARTEEPAALAPVAALRELYRRLGKDPSRYRGSPEALVRRARSGKPLYRIGNVVDAVNVVSLHTLLPIGLYDAPKVRPPITLRRGAQGETYRGIGRDELNLACLPVLADAEGPFGSPTSDSERTKVTDETREVLAVVFGVTGREELQVAVEMLASLLRDHAAAEAVEIDYV
jgi:DNA/RNA-binding domain of Phe-tRNA-synthetase-like protein